MSLHYDGVLCTLYYDRASLSETRLQPFDLGTMDQTPVNATLAISGTYLEGRLVDLIGKERGEKGSVEFDLRVVSLVTFRYGVYRRRRYVTGDNPSKTGIRFDVYLSTKPKPTNEETQAQHEIPDQAAFEADLVRCLRQSPVAAAIKVYPSYGRIAGNEIYMQRTYERDEVTPLKHSMLLVKSGRDQFGTPYWEFQDSSGETKGRGGYVRIRKGVGLLTEFVEMFLVEEEPPKKKRKAVSVDASHKRPKNVHNRLSLGPGKHSKSHKLSQGRSRSSSTSTSRKAGSSVRTISPKSPVPSASAFENMDASYLQTSGYLPADATEEQISMAAASMIRSHSMSGDLQPDPIAPKEELFPGNIITVTELNKKNPLNYAQVSVLADDILKNLEFDALHNKFHSVLSPEIIPKESEVGGKLGELDSCKIEAGETKGEVLQNLAEFLFSCVMFNAVLENACSEMGAGMSAMDRSSRNAGEMLDRLTLAYNRTLHASMPIETISGA
ncbi:hypothetical protein YC2023_093006 [Brassica napus]